MVCGNTGEGGFQLEGFGIWPSLVRDSNWASTPDLPGQRTLCLGKGSGVQVPVMSRSVDSMVGTNFGSGCLSKFSPLPKLRLHNLWFCSVVSEKQLCILLETG